jgi:Arf-GAP with coiled-coil, ANK repeat and PH domain-containing protein
MIDLEDCYGDGPSLRTKITSAEAYLHCVEGHLKFLHKLLKQSLMTLNEYSLNFSNLSKSLLDYGNFEAMFSTDHSNNRIISIGSEFMVIEDKRKKLIEELESFVVLPLVSFLRNEFGTLKELKKRFEKACEGYYHLHSKYMSKNSKDEGENGNFESAEEIGSTRKEFHEISLDYCLKLNELVLRKEILLNNIFPEMIQKLEAFYKFETNGMNLLLQSCETGNQQNLDQKEKISELYDKKTRILEKSLNLYNPLIIDKSLTPPTDQPTANSVKAGYLYKKSSKSHTMKSIWSRRFFELKQEKLIYFSKDSFDSHQAGSPGEIVEIDLKLCSVKECESEQRRFCFELLSPIKSYCLQAESEHEKHCWILALKQAIERNLSNNNFSIFQSGGIPYERPLSDEEKKEIQRENTECFDCKKQNNPDWALINYGVIICIDCSGAHRSRGVHKSKVKSLHLDHYSAEHVEILKKLGNQRVSSILENSNDTEEKYSNVKGKVLDMESVINNGDLLEFLKILINNLKSEIGLEYMEKVLQSLIDKNRPLLLSLALLWGYQPSEANVKTAVLAYFSFPILVNLFIKANLTDEQSRSIIELVKDEELKAKLLYILEIKDESEDEIESGQSTPETNKKGSKKRQFRKGIKQRLRKINLKN